MASSTADFLEVPRKRAAVPDAGSDTETEAEPQTEHEPLPRAVPLSVVAKRVRTETVEDIRRRHVVEWYLRYDETMPVRQSEYVQRIGKMKLPERDPEKPLPEISPDKHKLISAQLRIAGLGPLFRRLVRDTLGYDRFFGSKLFVLPTHGPSDLLHLVHNLRELHGLVHNYVFDFHPRRTRLTFQDAPTHEEAAAKVSDSRMYAILMGMLETIEDILHGLGEETREARVTAEV
jgi:hypothetical protein